MTDSVLARIHADADPQCHSGLSDNKWHYIWNSCCDKVAKEFRKEGLEQSALAAENWKTDFS